MLRYASLDGEGGHEAGRRLLREMYFEMTGLSMPEILTEERGKPYFADGDLHFSVSHTKKHVFCVLSEKPVGIDAEECDRRIDLRLADKILSPREKGRYDLAEDKRVALLRFWVLKEAAAKLSGQGLQGYPNQTDFDPWDPRIQKIDSCLVAVIE